MELLYLTQTEYKSLRSVLIPKSGNKSYCKNALQEPN